MPKFAIDPGHGFGNRQSGVFDSGAVFAGVREADVVLQHALTIKTLFAKYGERHGIPLNEMLFLTRDDNSDVTPVSIRDNLATQQGCTHFISLHLNAGGGKGLETYWRSADPEDRQFANLVHTKLVQALSMNNRGLKDEASSQHPHLAVLDFGPPGCLVELGFIDNTEDRNKLLTRSARIAVASAILGIWTSLAGRPAPDVVSLLSA